MLHLSSNALEALPDGVFRGLIRLEELDLSTNVLLELPLGIFKGITALKRLKLHDNRLKQLPPGETSGQLYEYVTKMNWRGSVESLKNVARFSLFPEWFSILHIYSVITEE